MRCSRKMTFLLVSFLPFVCGGLAAQEQESPRELLVGVTIDMSEVVRELSDLSTGEPTQEKQKEIVRKLDKLIEMLDQECQACKNSGASSANPSRPLADSMIVGGPGGIGDLYAPRAGSRKWGQLPDHERQRILQSMTEGFPPHYQKVLERYYRQLAEEKTASKTAQPLPRETVARPDPSPEIDVEKESAGSTGSRKPSEAGEDEWIRWFSG